MFVLTAFVFAVILSYAVTPGDAAKLVVYAPTGSRVRVERTNVAGHYSTVLMRNALIEGTPERVPILLEHFSFGWQALESLDFRCRLDAHDISPHEKFVLMRGMPKPQYERACEVNGSRDSGPLGQVEALRKRSPGPLLPSVIVIGDYAIVQWYGAGGGQRLYRRKADRWHFLLGGGGARASSEMAKFGVPKADWCRFGIIDAKCR